MPSSNTKKTLIIVNMSDCKLTGDARSKEYHRRYQRAWRKLHPDYQKNWLSENYEKVDR